MTTTTTTTTTAAEKENAFSSNTSNNKRKVDVSRSNVGRRAVVFSPKTNDPPTTTPVVAVASPNAGWMESFQDRQRTFLATIADHTVLQLLQAAADSTTHTTASETSHHGFQMIHDAVHEVTRKAKTLLQEHNDKGDRLQRQMEQETNTLSELKESLQDAMHTQEKRNSEIAALEQEMVRLRLETLSLGDQANATARQMTTMEQLEAKRHRRTLHQLMFFQRLSGIIWDYASIEKDSTRLVGQMVRDDSFFLVFYP
jgi:hypothetical protein